MFIFPNRNGLADHALALLDLLKHDRMAATRNLLSGTIAACARASPPRIDTAIELLEQVSFYFLYYSSTCRQPSVAQCRMLCLVYEHDKWHTVVIC